jgi:hypothetical protein
MSILILENNSQDNLGQQINELSKILNYVKNARFGCKIDFKNISFLHPTIILGLSSIISDLNKAGITHELLNVSPDIQSYLNTISFPVGIMPDFDTKWEMTLEKCRNKNYLPIVSFSTDVKEDPTNFRNVVLTKINELIAHKLELQIYQVGHISYFISEFTDNIVEHSGAKRGKIMVQYYPNKQFLEICILDDGKTLQAAYNDSGRFKINSNKEALMLALNGKSAKSQERGYGISTSTNLIVKGLDGKILMLSGDGMLTNTVVINYPSVWNGTMLSIKIPKAINGNWQNFI